MEYYFPEDPKEVKTVVNILSAFSIKRTSKKNMISHLYQVSDGEIVESVSEELYKSPLYYWILLLENNIINPYQDWCQPPNTIQQFTEKKYKYGIKKKLLNGTEVAKPSSIGLYGIHHYFNETTQSICDDTDEIYYRENPSEVPVNITTITNFDYEMSQNDMNRKINIVESKDLQTFVESFSTMLSSFSKNEVR